MQIKQNLKETKSINQNKENHFYQKKKKTLNFIKKESFKLRNSQTWPGVTGFEISIYENNWNKPNQNWDPNPQAWSRSENKP